MNRFSHFPRLVYVALLLEFAGSSAAATELGVSRQRLLYVASPGVRDNLEWGGHGVLLDGKRVYHAGLGSPRLTSSLSSRLDGTSSARHAVRQPVAKIFSHH